jgi:hypothetical protein
VSAALFSIPVAVLVERSKAHNPWVDFLWRPVSVLVGQPSAAPWTVLGGEGQATVFYAGMATIALHRTETGNYRDNLRCEAPLLWVVLRPTGVTPPYTVFAVTADPAEGEAFTETGQDLVETVPMPMAIRTRLEGFIAEHHVERPFYKRKRKLADPQAFVRRKGGRQEDSDD